MCCTLLNSAFRRGRMVGHVFEHLFGGSGRVHSLPTDTCVAWPPIFLTNVSQITTPIAMTQGIYLRHWRYHGRSVEGIAASRSRLEC